MGFFSRYSQESLEKKLGITQPEADFSPTALQVPIDLEMPDLNLQQVLEAHRSWRDRLQDVLDGISDEQFDVDTVSQDCHCFLGKWLYSKGKKMYGHLPEFESVRQAHAEFHLCAGQVLREHLFGDPSMAQKLLKTKFRSASNRNQLELGKLFGVAKLR